MAVDMIIDQWNPSRRRYRTETFCYGPLACPFYESGPARKVPGRHGMSYTEDDWVDVDATSYHRSDELLAIASIFADSTGVRPEFSPVSAGQARS